MRPVAACSVTQSESWHVVGLRIVHVLFNKGTYTSFAPQTLLPSYTYLSPFNIGLVKDLLTFGHTQQASQSILFVERP